jgi:crossover junction endodeoxyribonuclease RuvC
VRVFGIDPGCERTGYGCIESDGSRHRLVDCGAIVTASCATFPDKLLAIHQGLVALVAAHAPDVVAVESLFYAVNVRSALKLGHARGVAILAAVARGVPVAEYSPAEVKRAVVGYGRAEKHQVGAMVRLLLGLPEVPEPHDASDALAVAICHVHAMGPAGLLEAPDLTPRDTHAQAQGPHLTKSRGGRPSRGFEAPSPPASQVKTWRKYRPPGEIR